MTLPHAPVMSHPEMTRRTALQAGAVGLLGLGMNHLEALQAAVPAGAGLAVTSSLAAGTGLAIVAANAGLGAAIQATSTNNAGTAAHLTGTGAANSTALEKQS